MSCLCLASKIFSYFLHISLNRGRWKSRRRVSDDYDDIELPYIDAKVAGLLCISGPCKYKVRMTDSIII